LSSRRRDHRRSNTKPRRRPVRTAPPPVAKVEGRAAEHDAHGHVEEDESGFERLIFFSDAVFAIAITLLIIDIHLPDNAGSDLAGALRHLEPSFEGFVISFLVIALYWVSHHRLFGSIRTYDTRLIWINIWILMLIVFLPFSSSMVSSYGEHRVAVIFYALNLAAIGLLFLLLWLYATYHGRLISPSTPIAVIRRTTLRLGVPPLVFFLSIPIALVNTNVAKYSWLMIPVLFRVAQYVVGPDNIVERS